jgi:hypothetical protein
LRVTRRRSKDDAADEDHRLKKPHGHSQCVS